MVIRRRRWAIPFRKMRCFFATLPTIAIAGIIFHADFRDIAASAGLTVRNTFGGAERKNFILETTGNGAAIFDYDGDGRDDIFIANGRRLQAEGQPPQLYRNEGGGHFRNVAKQAGVANARWVEGGRVGG